MSRPTHEELVARVFQGMGRCGCGHPSGDHDEAGACMHLCDCAWPGALIEPRR